MEQMTPVLVVTPHPDDAEGGAGGTIARWTKQGRKVVLIVCTNGDKGTSDRNVKPEDLARLRAEEQRQAAEVLGIAEVVFLRFPDQGLEDCSEFREKLVRQIRIHRPETVVTIDPHHRYNPEHVQEGLEPHKVREVYLWGAEEPDTFLDITDTFTTKLDALYCHASQMKRPRAEREANTRAHYAEIGKKAGVELAEAFKRIEIFR